MKVIKVRVTEPELFDLIMAVYPGATLFQSSEGEGTAHSAAGICSGNCTAPSTPRPRYDRRP